MLPYNIKLLSKLFECLNKINAQSYRRYGIYLWNSNTNNDKISRLKTEFEKFGQQLDKGLGFGDWLGHYGDYGDVYYAVIEGRTRVRGEENSDFMEFIESL